MENVGNSNFLVSVGKGVLVSFLFTLVALFVFSILLVYTNLSEATIKPVIITLTGVSILLGSSVGTRKLKKNGMLNGCLIGGCYIFGIYIISSILSSNYSFNLSSVIMILVGMICGVLGGIIGINSKK